MKPRARFVPLALLVLFFASAALVFRPFASSARPREAFSDSPALGELTTRDLRLLIHATRAGPRYTVTNLRGRTLARDLSADDVYRLYPDLAPDALHLGPDDPPARLMLVDPER